jgi:hypothetical protein
MSEDVFDKPLVMKDFVKERRKISMKKPKKLKLYEKVKNMPESKRHKRQSKYLELINSMAKEKKGTYKVLLNSIKPDLSPKSAYPSIEKALMQIAKRDGVDFNLAIRRQVQTKKGLRAFLSYPEYTKWKEENLRLRVVNGEIFIEKKTDRPL